MEYLRNRHLLTCLWIVVIEYGKSLKENLLNQDSKDKFKNKKFEGTLLFIFYYVPYFSLAGSIEYLV